MAKTAILSVRMIGDAKNLTAAFQSATGGLDKWESRTKKAATAMTAVSAGVVAFAKTAVDSAANLEQSVGAVDAVFKGSADQMHQWGKAAAESVGLSRNEYNEFATVIGSQLKNLGIPMDEIGTKTNDLVELGADLASMYGGTTADAVSSLSAVFRGETDPIEKYGVSIKQSDVNARMAADGLDELEGEALKNAEANTRLKMVMEQTADAHGNFAREVDTVQHKQQVATAKFEDAKAKLGEGLLPIVAAITDKFAVFAEKLGENPDLVMKVGGAILGLTGALWAAWAAMKIWSTVSAITNGAKAAWSVMSKAMVADNVAVEASSKGSALRSALAWIANAARAAGAWVLMQVRALATFGLVAARAGVSAAAAAGAWVANAARAAGAWLLMQARALITFGLVAAQAAVSAAATATAWVVANARAAASFLLVQGPMMAVRGATLAMAAAQGVLNAVMAMNPIMLVVIAVAALVAALVLAYNKCEGFRNAVQTAGSIAASVFGAIVGFVQRVIGTIGSLISRAGGIGGVFRSAMSAAARAVDILMTPIQWLINKVSDLIGWIGRIKFPSMPGWMSKLNPFSMDVGPQAASMAAPMTMSSYAAPVATLAAAPTPALSSYAATSLTGVLAGLKSAADGIGSGSPTEMITVNVEVSGAVLADDYALAETIERVLRKRGRATGRKGAGR